MVRNRAGRFSVKENQLTGSNRPVECDGPTIGLNILERLTRLTVQQNWLEPIKGSEHIHVHVQVN